MVTAYRIFQSQHSGSWNDGEGAFRYGGRWNTRGTRILYAAASLALAALEMLVHLEDEEMLAEYRYAAVSFPEGAIQNVEEIVNLPADWREYPAPTGVRYIGDRWVRSGSPLVLRVPTAVLPRESNYLINVGHPNASLLEYGSVESFAFDPRFGRKRGSKK